MLHLQSLAGRLFKTVFSSYLILAVIVTVIQLMIEYSATKRLIGNDLDSLAKSFSPSVAGALWELDRPLMKTMTQGIAQSSIVTGVSISSDTGESYATVGTIPATVSTTPVGMFAPYQQTSTILKRQTPNGERILGSLTIVADRSVALQRIKHSFIVILVNSIIKTAGLWVIFYLVITRGLSHPLSQLNEFVSRIRFASESANPEPLQYPHNDELGQLTDSMNLMLERLKKARYELEQSNQHLEQTVAERTRSLSEAVETADAANRSKSAFLANMSHEIRTPLNAIIGFSKLVDKTVLTREQHAYVRNIITSGELLLAIINDILDFSKIEAGKLTLERVSFNLRQCVAQVLSIIQYKATEKGLQVMTTIADPVPQLLVGDLHRLSQILVNLLGNAVKFTETGTIQLQINLLEQTADDRAQLIFTVIDSGIGIAPEQCQSLFDPFTQADDSTTRKYGGTGLGLSICKRLVELMDGTISCSSTVGHGSSFSFTAWFGIAEGTTAEIGGYCPEPNEHPAGEEMVLCKGTHILLVEDNELNQQLMVALLHGIGSQVSTAANGEEALQLLDAAGPCLFDLVLMDIQMPVMDGFEATRRIRSNEQLKKLPIIALTAHALAEECQSILSCGMNDYLTKPVDEKQLHSTIAKWLHTGSKPADSRLSPAPVAGMATCRSIPGVNMNQALARLNGDSRLYGWVLEMFVETYANAGTIMKSLIQQQDYATAERLAHSLKGDAGTVSSADLWDAAQTVELALHNREPAETIQGLLDELTRKLDQLLKNITTAR